jgi:triphosphoribosyl-dephospho-CoA synthetase
MDISHFRLSAAALRPFFERMAAEATWLDSSRELAVTLRTLGIEAETAMLAATGGINTHKGAIWTLGLLCAASGTHAAALAGSTGFVSAFTAEAVCDEAAALARRIIALPPLPQTPLAAASMVDGFLASRLSPGGAADLCAAALFLADLETGWQPPGLRRGPNRLASPQLRV